MIRLDTWHLSPNKIQDRSVNLVTGETSQSVKKKLNLFLVISSSPALKKIVKEAYFRYCLVKNFKLSFLQGPLKSDPPSARQAEDF